MRSRSQITPEPEIQRRVRQRARDPRGDPPAANPAAVFDLGSSGGSDVSRDKKAMVGDAFASGRAKPSRTS
jgi:hypothetical protein